MLLVFPAEIANVRPFEKIIVPDDHAIVSASVTENTMLCEHSSKEISVDESLGIPEIGTPEIDRQ
jgi:hypothetical protein